MAVSVTKVEKGGNVNLSKNSPNMTKVLVGLGWDPRTTDGQPFDLDASAIVCGAGNKVLSEEHFVFFNNLSDPEGSVVHQGDNLTGDGDGDDEQLIVDLTKISPEAEKVVVIVSIYDAESRNQSFGQVSNSYIRLIDNDNPLGEEVRYDLGEDASTERSMVFAEIYKNNGDWKFRAIGQGYGEGLAGVIRDYGLSAA